MDTFRGRHSARIEGEFVVLLIGMRINKPWKVHRWLPVFTAMAKMTLELSRDPESGFLGSRPGVRMSVHSLQHRKPRTGYAEVGRTQLLREIRHWWHIDNMYRFLESVKTWARLVSAPAHRQAL